MDWSAGVVKSPSMRRRMFTLVSAVSLLLCAAICVLWGRSYWVSDRVIGDRDTLRGRDYTMFEYYGFADRGMVFARMVRSLHHFDPPSGSGCIVFGFAESELPGNSAKRRRIAEKYEMRNGRRPLVGESSVISK